MSLNLGSNYAAPARTPRTTSAHKRSSSTSSTTSISSTTSSSSSISSNSGASLRERRGVTFQLPITGISGLPADVKLMTPKGHLEPHFDNMPRRRRALPTPIAIFDSSSVMGRAGVKSSSLRDFGMGEDGWTVAL